MGERDVLPQKMVINLPILCILQSWNVDPLKIIYLRIIILLIYVSN